MEKGHRNKKKIAYLSMSLVIVVTSVLAATVSIFRSQIDKREEGNYLSDKMDGTEKKDAVVSACTLEESENQEEDEEVLFMGCNGFF